MHKINVLIVEDEMIVSEEIKELLLQKGYEVAGQATSAAEAMEVFESSKVDVALLDINIKGGIDGIQLAQMILDRQRCAIIFVTAYDDDHFLNRAKEVKPAAYIVKPFEERNLQMAIEIAFNNLMETNLPPEDDSFVISDFIFVKDNTRFKKVPIDSILFAKAEGSYTEIHTQNGKSTIAINLKAFENGIENSRFLRVHRSYLINLDKVEEYEGNQVFIKGISIPISSNHKEDFLQKFRFI